MVMGEATVEVHSSWASLAVFELLAPYILDGRHLWFEYIY